ncbi:hypothetical protein [Kitasatospora sp. MBT66]|uniref:hypothetical protein n=1 Tax=Kitasatospora sp. MBT66 TaxID=1444769 RepID=UPI0011EA6CF3|nr:hypothetical protein [Kitasatospora sp. MBT66]
MARQPPEWVRRRQLRPAPAGPRRGRSRSESAPDDRYTLFYAVHSHVPDAQHNDVARKVRDLLTTEGLKISAYQETPATEPNSTVTARHPGSRYIVDVSSTAGDNRMVLGITTPCLKPPTGPAATTP